MPSDHKYARTERERRFLLAGFPRDAEIVRTRRIADRYIDGTSLRLRRTSDEDGSTVFKLTQKIPLPGPGAQQGFITTMYLRNDEYLVFANLPASQITKTRYSVPPFGIDVFEGELKELVLAEAEFDSAMDAEALSLPSFVVREVSADNRFTGGRLAHASRRQLKVWLEECGIYR
jgi:CYTH domain-containing protein